MAATTGLTIEDFEGLPEVLVLNHELVDGELVKIPGSKPPHNLFRDLLVTMLGPFVKEHEQGMIISGQAFDFDGNVHAPDVSFISGVKRHLINPKLRVQLFVPDLAIEIESDDDTFAALTKKVSRYRRCGTKEAWIFSLETRAAYVYSDQRGAILDENDEFRPETVPGFAIRIGDLFDRCR